MDRLYIGENLIGILASRAGTRNLLDKEWCKSLAVRLNHHASHLGLFPKDAVAVQCTLFDKTRSASWRVPYHQDLSIPVKQKIAAPECSLWSEKEGVVYTQPPGDVLDQLVAVRVHLDDCGSDNGPLRVIPTSHHQGCITEQNLPDKIKSGSEVVCSAKNGDVLVMRPLLLHASSKPANPSSRRVLHFLYGPRQLPYGLEWHQVV